MSEFYIQEIYHFTTPASRLFSCLGAVGAASDGAKRVTISFMQRNALYAKRNFGNNADNATGIVLYISQDPRLPSL